MKRLEDKEQLNRNILLSISRLGRNQTSFYRLITSVLNQISIEDYSRGIYHYSRVKMKTENPSLEISVLTPSNLIYDFTYENGNLSTTAFNLSKATEITLDTKYFDAANNDNNLEEYMRSDFSFDQPYRAELRFWTGDSINLIYEVEGDRRLVQSLIDYGKKCITRFSSKEETDEFF
jgi:hypothetical protein